MASAKPYVAVACFCENLLEGKDDVLSVIRIVDTYTVHDEKPEGMPPDALPGILVTGLIALRSSGVSGSHKVRLVMETPLGERKDVSPPEGWTVVIGDQHSGVNLKLKFPLGVKNYGKCWFDVLFDDELITRIPLTLLRAAEPVATDSTH